MPQCKGITSKGDRCKRTLKSKNYCHDHDPAEINKYQPENNGKNQRKFSSSTSSDNLITKHRPPIRHTKIKISSEPQMKITESIYMYTFSHLATKNPVIKNWIKVGDSVPFNPHKHILVKIGRTSQRVGRRIDQWTSQCNHNIRLLEPNILKDIAPSSLTSLFKNFSLNESSMSVSRYLETVGTKIKLEEDKLMAYNYETRAFDCGLRSKQAEKMIHKTLREKYGFVEIECEQCQLNGKGTHKEWFVLPRDRVIKVFLWIDRVCDELVPKLR